MNTILAVLVAVQAAIVFAEATAITVGCLVFVSALFIGNSLRGGA